MKQRIDDLYRKIKDKLENADEFLKSSALLYISQLVVNFFSYVILIGVLFIDDSVYADWLAAGSLVNVLAAPAAGFFSHINIQTASLYSSSQAKAKLYTQKYRKYIHRCIACLLIIAPIAPFALSHTVQSNDYLFSLLLFLVIISHALLSFYNFILLGYMKFAQFSIVQLCMVVTRAFLSLSLLYLFGIYAFVIGYFASNMFGILVNSYILHKIEKNIHSNETVSLDIVSEIKKIVPTVLSVQGLAWIFGLSPVIGALIFDSDNAKIFAIVFTFAQIIHYGSISAMGALMSYGAQDKSKRILTKSIAMVTCAGMLFFSLFIVLSYIGRPVLEAIGKPEYSLYIPQLALIGVYILLFNIFFVSIRYFLSKQYYRTTFFVYILLLFQFGTVYITHVFHSININNYIIIHILSTIITLVLLVIFKKSITKYV